MCGNIRKHILNDIQVIYSELMHQIMQQRNAMIWPHKFVTLSTNDPLVSNAARVEADYVKIFHF